MLTKRYFKRKLNIASSKRSYTLNLNDYHTKCMYPCYLGFRKTTAYHEYFKFNMMLLTIKLWEIWLLRFKKVHKLYQGRFCPFPFIFLQREIIISRSISGMKRGMDFKSEAQNLGSED